MYADSCVLSDSDLQRWNITFKKIPRDIEHIQKGMRYGIKKISVTGNKGFRQIFRIADRKAEYK